MKKLVKESLNEIHTKPRPKDHSNIDEVFYQVTEYLRRKIYPKLNDDDMYELNTRLKQWFNENV